MRWPRLLFVLLFLPLAACALNGPRVVRMDELTKTYTLDAGDVVKVAVYGDDTISRTYRVDDTGHISFPLVGAVMVKGMTTEQAAAAIRAGANLTPDHAVGHRTWEEFLRDRLADARTEPPARAQREVGTPA